MLEPEPFLDGRVLLHPGDCLDVLARLAENSFDACCTDPPYHLTSIVQRFGANGAAPAQFGTDGAYARASAGFMGRKWDGGDIAFRPETWAAVFRVLKPGAHLVAMGGTRTYHRLACAIEDAGFEIRDTLGFLYGVGFPKSHDIGKKLDASNARCACHDQLRGLRDTTDDAVRMVQEDAASDVLATMQRIPTRQGMGDAWSQGSRGLDGRQQGECSPKDDGATQPGMEGGCDIPEAAWELRECPIREMPAGFDVDGEGGRLCDGAPSSDGATDRSITDPSGMRPSSRPPTVEQPAKQSGAMARQPQPQERGTWDHCDRCGKPIIPDGLGTALKPAMELIVLARKPLSEGTVAANVLRWGTGAINVDGCRIEAPEGLTSGGVPTGGNNPCFMSKDNDPRTERGNGHALGRWPANVVHDGSDEVVAAFPDTASGTLTAEHRRNGGYSNNRENEIFGKGSERGCAEDAFTYGASSGSAARFFYTSKADADDRLGSKHPTVKPVDLMQWLVRLVTPPGGRVLDPFAGTGTTGEAAWREGMRAVLIEAEPEYQADIRRRMALVLAGPGERMRESIKAKNLPRDDGPLFGGIQEAAE